GPAPQPFQGWHCLEWLPRVARPSQPWALLRNAFGIRKNFPAEIWVIISLGERAGVRASLIPSDLLRLRTHPPASGILLSCRAVSGRVGSRRHLSAVAGPVGVMRRGARRIIETLVGVGAEIIALSLQQVGGQ